MLRYTKHTGCRQCHSVCTDDEEDNIAIRETTVLLTLSQSHRENSASSF